MNTFYISLSSVLCYISAGMITLTVTIRIVKSHGRPPEDLEVSGYYALLWPLVWIIYIFNLIILISKGRRTSD